MVTLKEGDKAPAFTGVDQNEKKVSLTDFKGKKVVLYFYPEDDTPTCTIQACNLRDNYGLLKKNGFFVIALEILLLSTKGICLACLLILSMQYTTKFWVILNQRQLFIVA